MSQLPYQANLLTRQQQQRENLCVAVIRSLSQHPDLYFRGHRLYQSNKALPFYAGHLQLNPAEDSSQDLRGVGDALALRLLNSDHKQHQTLSPTEPITRLVFEYLEQLRVESLTPASLPGVTENLKLRFSTWSENFHNSGLADSAIGILLLTLTQMVWARLTGHNIPESLAEPMEATRAGIAPLIGNDLQNLKKQRQNQVAYAQHAIHIAQCINDLIQQANHAQGKSDAEQNALDPATQKLLLMLDSEAQEGEDFISVLTGQSRSFEAHAEVYQIFNTQYDRTIRASQLVRPELLRELRSHLDKQISRQGLNVQRLARLLQRIFTRPYRNGWDMELEQGYLDANRLSLLISSPEERRLFKREAHPPHNQATVSFLLDCSGSMKVHADALAMLLDVFGRALEQADVGCEILGFTTNAWSGGRVMQQWIRQGRPDNPGRLTETCHLIYKSSEQRWRQARHAITALLKPELFREGIDGEAVDWACQRLLKQEYERRILVVISDGCPMDSATQQANDAFYLDNHLQQVIKTYQKQGKIDIYGLGVGLDLSPYYDNSLILDMESGISQTMLTGIAQLWTKHSLFIHK